MRWFFLGRPMGPITPIVVTTHQAHKVYQTHGTQIYLNLQYDLVFTNEINLTVQAIN